MTDEQVDRLVDRLLAKLPKAIADGLDEHQTRLKREKDDQELQERIRLATLDRTPKES